MVFFMTFIKSKHVVFISECLVNQNIRAYGVGNVQGEGPCCEILDLLSKNGIGLTVVPCPEIFCQGLKRNACDKEYYNNSTYRTMCSQIADYVLDRYKMYLDDGYTVGGFICVNGSPSCAIDYCYCDKRKCLEAGVLIEELQAKLKACNLELDFIGVRMKELDIALKKINEMILRIKG